MEGARRVSASFGIPAPFSMQVRREKLPRRQAHPISKPIGSATRGGGKSRRYQENRGWQQREAVLTVVKKGCQVGLRKLVNFYFEKIMKKNVTINQKWFRMTRDGS